MRRGGRRERKRASTRSLKRVNWDAIFDRRLIKVTALVVIRKDVTRERGSRDFPRLHNYRPAKDLLMKRASGSRSILPPHYYKSRKF